MPTNPFYVSPVDITPGLRGLQATFEKAGELKREKAEKERVEAMKKRAAEVYQTGDPDQMAEFSLQNPEMTKAITTATGFKNKRTEENYRDSLFELYQNPTIEKAQELVADRQELLRSQGVGPEGSEGTDTFLQDFTANPEGVRKRIAEELAFRYPERWKAMREATAPIETKDTRTPDVKNYEYARSQGFEGSLLDFQAQGKDPEGKTTAIKEFEYAQKNPEFAVAQKVKEDNARTKKISLATFKDSSDLRKEFLSQSKEYQKTRDSYTRVVGSTKEPSPAGDLSLIFNYMKMLDPGSVVRESEFATAASTGSYGQRMQAGVQKVLSGERLAPEMRADFVKKAAVLFKGMQDQHKKREINYRGIAEKNGLPVDQVVVDITAPPETEQVEPEQTTRAITTQEEYDLLPPGTTYTMDGVEYRKGQ